MNMAVPKPSLSSEHKTYQRTTKKTAVEENAEYNRRIANVTAIGFKLKEKKKWPKKETNLQIRAG